LEKDSVMDIVNGEQANQMRLKMLQGHTCVECKSCYVMEKNGHESARIVFNKKYSHLKHHMIEQTNADGSIRTFQPSYLDLRLNNTCNLKCRTCDGRASSQLAQEEKKLFDNSFNLDRIPNKISRSRALEKVIGFVEQSNDIYFAGGEPLLMHEHFAILDHLIELNKTDVRLRYNTNFTLQSYKNRNILDIWQLFPNVALAASLDGHGAIFEYVRHGASWSDIEKNFLALKTKCPHVEFTVSSTISIFSAESVMELQKKWHQSGMLDIKYFKLNSVSTNDYFNLCSLLPHHKTYLSKKIDDHIDWLMSIGGIELASDWQMCKQTMWQHDKKYLSLMIASVNRARDIERKENFESLFPQFADLFDNNGAKTQFNFVR
jgi:sulfatase maturation enzyme AslB (radical SAM superfamily)